MKVKSVKIVHAPRTYTDVLHEVDPKVIDFNDQRIMKTVFWDGNMTGIFQVTSGGMAKLFQRVKPECFNDVAATAALYRPGPLGSGMDKMYADRKNGLEKVEYEHPLLKEILGETYGVYVYQEQVLELCRRVAGMSWKDTNRVRKLRLKKDKSKSADLIAKEESELRELFVSGLSKNGISHARAEQLWKDLEAWGSYGFNVAHAKSYGMVTMQTAYLRTHYPMEFFAALLSKGQAADLQSYVNDIRRQGFEVKPIDANLSSADYKVEGNGIRLALSSVKGVGPSAVQKIVAGQPYSSFGQFLLDSGVSKTIVNALIHTGAFNDLEPGVSIATLVLRHETFRADKKLSHKKNRESTLQTLAAMIGPADDPIALMVNERELLGFNLRGTPFSINSRNEKIDRLIDLGLCESGLGEFIVDEEKLSLVAPLLVKSIREKPQKNGKLFAFLKLSDRDGNEVEAPAWANVWEHVRSGIREGDAYVIVLHRKADDPGRIVVGKPGWAHTARSAASYFLPVDKLEV